MNMKYNDKNTYTHVQSRLLLKPLIKQPPLTIKGLGPAAVMVIIVHDSLIPHVLLTQRQFHLRSHPGQFSFPGGKPEPHVDRTLLDTALRETQEEIGLCSDTLNCITALNNFNTFSGFKISPFVAHTHHSQNLSLCYDEVYQVLRIPLPYILNPKHYYVTQHQRINLNNDIRLPQHYSVYHINYIGHYIWGATAGILLDLACQLTPDKSQFLKLINTEDNSLIIR